MATTLKYKEVTTRKAHRCFSCVRIFPIGAKMFYWVGTIGSDFNASYCCNTCSDIISYDDETEYDYGYVDNMLSEGQTPEDLLNEIKSNDKAKNI